ncbi:MAG TPA: FlgD immunoglobulin-like domain containing protein [Candidatus Eisenbacteria bacterium]|nr:FlgD immunoglobulin-like domain containing protein [Candidatus Eisenbacteria bacterium]
MFSLALARPGGSTLRGPALFRPAPVAFPGVRLSVAAILAAAALAWSAPALAQDEFLLNDDRVDRNQWVPRVAVGATGALVVAWMDGRNGAPVVDFDIYMLTLRDPQGLGSTVNRRLNDDVSGTAQALPDIAGSPAGTFFCVWEDSRSGNRDIYGAALDSLGIRITPNLRLNDDGQTFEQLTPQVVAVGSNRYLAVWGDQRTTKGEIYGVYVTASGAILNPNFKISVDPVAAGSYQGEPALAARPDGSVLVAWLDGREGGTVFGTTFDVYAQLLDPGGNPVGGNFKLNGTTTFQRNTSVAVAAGSDGYVVGWIDRRNAGDPGDVYAQRVLPGGALLGGNIRVNDDTHGRDQRSVRAVSTPSGAHLLWEDLRGNLGLDSNVQMARVGYDDLPAGPNTRVNALVPARQGTPGGAWDGRDGILAVWEDARNGAPDIYAISILPDGTRRNTETQLNDDAAPMDQRRPRMGRGPGRYVATWIDRRSGTNDLFGQWLTSAGGRDGANHRITRDDFVNRPVSAEGAVSSAGPALVAVHMAGNGDAGEIRGFRYTTTGQPPVSEFWISDDLPSSQSTPSVTATDVEFGAAWIDTREGRPRVYGQRLALDGARIGVNHPVLPAEPANPVYALDLEADPLGGYWLAYAAGASVNQRLWITHLDGTLVADRAPVEVAAGETGERASPSVGVGPDGRVEVVWLGRGTTEYSTARHQAFDKDGAVIGPPLAVDPSLADAAAGPSISVAGTWSFVAWEAKHDGNWSIFLRGFQDGTAPSTSVLRVDQDVLGADQLDPSVGADAGGRLVVIWTDARSTSSGTDILGRVYSFGPTSVTEEDPPDPPPVPEPAPPPASLRVGPAWPNPFSSRVGIALEAPPRGQNVRVTVLDASGRRVATLHDGPVPSGSAVLRWTGEDVRSRSLPSGVYWIVAESEGERRALRIVHLR